MTEPENQLQVQIPNSQLAGEEEVGLLVRVTEMRKYHKLLPEFIIALSTSKSMSEAERRIRRHIGWHDMFPPEVLERCHDLADEMRLEPLLLARSIMNQGVVQAAMVKMKGLSAAKEADRQRAATDILNRTLGKAVQPSTKDVRVEVVSNLAWSKKVNAAD